MDNTEDAHKLAIALHSALCHKDHNEDCSWEYETNWNRCSHTEYLEIANEMLATKIPVETIITIFKVLE